MSDAVIFELDGKAYETEIYDKIAPQTCKVLRSLRPINGAVHHAMWSGPLCLMLFDLNNVPRENETTFFSPGDLLYHPYHKEIGIAYGPTQFQEPSGGVYVTLIGRLLGDLTQLKDVGSRLQFTGERPLVIR